jgi:predicted Zn finger-like uncharacterized protein
MYSQCPECHTRFRVTAEALRAAHGTVRCGRCGIAFDALARLSDTPPPARTGLELPPIVDAQSQLTALPDAAGAAEYHFTADDLEKVFIDVREWQKQFGTEPPAEDTASQPEPAGESHVVVDENEPIEDITLEGERISIEAPPGFDDDLDSTDEFAVARDVPDSAYPEDEDTGEIPVADEVPEDLERTRALDYLLEPEAEPDSATVATAEPVVERLEPTLGEPAPLTAPEPGLAPPIMADAVSAGTLATQRWRRSADAEFATAAAEAKTRERSGWRTLAWTLGCLLLAIALLAQVVHYYRQDLVRHPALGPVLRDVYDRLRIPLSPNWDLAAFELRKWGNGDGPEDGRMSIRASLTNRAAFAQPHPILRLQLDDRFGESIAIRDFEPAEYLKNPAEASRLLGPAASTEAELVIVDPGQDAVGYRLDVCLRESPTQLRCAQGQG